MQNQLTRGPQRGLLDRLLTLGKRPIRPVVSLIKGHRLLRKHLIIAGIYKLDVTCRLCGLREETANHIDFDCDALERNRHELTLAVNRKYWENTDIVSVIRFIVKGIVIGLTV